MRSFTTAGQTPVTANQPHKQLDAQGLMCPEPVMLLHNAVRDMQAGELLEVLATDPLLLLSWPRTGRTQRS